MAKQRKLFTLSDEAVSRLEVLSQDLGIPRSNLVETFIDQAYRRHIDAVCESELCRMVYDRAASEVRFEDMAGGVLAVFKLSAN